jgi:hypothetical protein
MISQFLAYAVNNLAILAAGGLLAIWLAWRMWKKVESIMSTTQSWGGLAFWAVRLVVVAYMLFWVGKFIYGTVQAAVVSLVNSPSTQVAANTLVGLGGLADAFFSPEFNFDNTNSGGQLVNIPAPDAQPSVNAGAVTFAAQPAPAPAAAPAAPVVTNEQAVAAVNALAAKDDSMTYINQFVADNTPVDAAIACGGSYTIKPGDSLAKIAKACYGDSNQWVKICQANGLRDCNNVRAGVVLVIPGNKPNMALVQNQIPESFGHQPNYQAQPAPVYAVQPAQQAAAPVRNLANNQIVVNTPADAVAAINALAPPPVPTARPAYVLTEVLGKPQTGGGQAYIDEFLAKHNNTTVAQAGQ